MSAVELYIDYFSQPSRAVLSFCLINNIPINIHETEILKGATDTAAFQEISPPRTVPAIIHNGLALYESHAILIYLSSAFSTPDHWYPNDPAAQSNVNVYLHWHHLNIRYSCGHYFNRKLVRPLFTKREFSAEFEKDMLFVQRKSFEFIESTLTKQKYVGGTSQPSIADISCFCELIQLKLMNVDYSKYPRITEWMKEIASIPGVHAAHQSFYKTLGTSKL